MAKKHKGKKEVDKFKRYPDGDETFLEGATGEAEYKYAWARAIADAWEDPQKARDLQRYPRAVLAKHGFEAPPGLEIEVWIPEEDVKGYGFKNLPKNKRYPKGEAYDSATSEWIEEGLRSTVEMIIPPKPNGNEAFALEDYKAIGKSYPFTSGLMCD